MYTTLSGWSLFGKSDVLQLAYKHSQEMPVSFRARGIALPERLEAIVFKALAKDVVDRFQTINQLADELKLVQAELSSPHVREEVSDETSSWLRELIVAPQLLKNPERSTVALQDTPNLQGTNGASYVEVRELTPMRASSDEQTVDLKIPRRFVKSGRNTGFFLVAGAVAFGTFNAGEQANRSLNKLPVINNSLVEPQPMPTRRRINGWKNIRT